MVDRQRGLRKKAWAYGRLLRNQLVEEYRQEYGVDIPPPPALIVDELLTDFLNVELRYLPLSDGIYAQTEYDNDVVVVTVNELTSMIPGVKDAIGVQNVGKFHELIHVDQDLDEIRPNNQNTLPGFETPSRIRCYRESAITRSSRGSEWKREFWAEEAGRAAAVSYSALTRSDSFMGLSKASYGATMLSNAELWRLLYLSAEEIGVNISALVTQLSLEGWISVDRIGGRNIINVQRSLINLMEETR